jgi:DNA-binding transcriptional MerR regulator
MESPSLKTQLPPIPAKRYFTIGEVSDLCGVKPHVLRYWEQEFTQLKPVKRRGNRRYYQHHEVLLIRRIRDLLYDQGFTISGARNQLDELSSDGGRSARTRAGDGMALSATSAGATSGLMATAHAPHLQSDSPGGMVRKEIEHVLALLRA